ncbi:acyltransferase [Bradyrhizobium jicamae]|uniref:acyltransferase family protein n=1 Tax=Bradyrhizobium jicamae TaxID=280332 RepID=UPI001BAB26B6|nr:acyltransferase [Bradyrhizobium jicamae]MBR0758573.1 acyltransferase [Bradyrhizobium jicamae]
MRGLAALAVVCGHAVIARSVPGTRSIAEGAHTILASGVDIFFVISGFIIATAAAAQTDAPNFVLRRVVRIYPVYWLVLLAAFISSYWIAPPGGAALRLGEILAWDYPNGYVPPAWSIAFEMHFYAVVAALLAIAPDRLFEGLSAMLGIAVVAIVLRLPLGIYSHPLILEFGAGVLIAYLARVKDRLPMVPYATAASAALFAAGWYWIFVVGASDPQFARVPTYGLGATLLVYTVVSAEHDGACFSPILQWLGSISYSLYISHYLLIRWLASPAERWQIASAGAVVASILLSIGLAAILHRLVEMPLRNWGRKLSVTRKGGEALTSFPGVRNPQKL